MSPVLASAIALSLAAGPGGFEAQKKKANDVDNLGKVVATLVGDCSGADFENAIACQENLAKAEKKIRRQSHYLWLGAAEGLIRYEGMKGKKARIILTPMFDAGSGFAMTVGKPLKLDKKSGTPVVKVLVLDGELADGMLESDIKRALRLGMMSVEMVGKFGKPFALKGGSKGAVRGVMFQPKMIRFSNARSGKPIVDVSLKK